MFQTHKASRFETQVVEMIVKPVHERQPGSQAAEAAGAGKMLSSQVGEAHGRSREPHHDQRDPKGGLVTGGFSGLQNIRFR